MQDLQRKYRLEQRGFPHHFYVIQNVGGIAFQILNFRPLFSRLV
jgi:hypothetical protein